MMRPLASRYVSVPGHVAEEQVERWRWEIAAFAEQEGLALAEMFTDRRGRSQNAFDAMTEALRRLDAPRIVVVPAVEHLARLPGLQHADQAEVERHVGARIVAVHLGHGTQRSGRRRRRWGRSARRS